jgi:hypothetical protein
MKFTWWKSGSWNAICDVCGFKFKSTDLRYTGDIGSRAGLMACKDCYDPPHPQEFIRPIQDQAKLPWTRPEATDTYLTIADAGSVLIPAGGTSATINNSIILSTSKIIITGTVPVDPRGILGKITVASGTATIFATVTPLNDWTISYRIIV